MIFNLKMFPWLNTRYATGFSYGVDQVRAFPNVNKLDSSKNIALNTIFRDSHLI